MRNGLDTGWNISVVNCVMTPRVEPDWPIEVSLKIGGDQGKHLWN
jgi:hypothetical protein